MQFPLERGLGGFVKMYDEAHRGFDKQNLRGLKKTAKVFPKKSLFFERCFYSLPFTQNFHHEAKNSRHRHRTFGHYCA